MKRVKVYYKMNGTLSTKTYDLNNDDDFTSQILKKGRGRITLPGHILQYRHLEHVDVETLPDQEPTP